MAHAWILILMMHSGSYGVTTAEFTSQTACLNAVHQIHEVQKGWWHKSDVICVAKDGGE